MPSLLMPRAVLSGHLATVSLITVLIANFQNSSENDSCGSVVVVVVEDFGSWVLPPSLNCLLAPCPSTLTRLALWVELFQQKIQSTVAEADRREPTVRLLMVQLQLAVKEGTISYSILFCTLYLLYKAV